MSNNNREIIANFDIGTTNIESDCEINTGDKFEFNIDIKATPEKTSQLINDGDGESPFVTENNIQTPENSVIELIKDNNIITIKSTTYIHDQGVASNVWEIEHNLDKKPSITVVDSGDTVISIYKKEYDGMNKVILTFNGAFKGKAYLN